MRSAVWISITSHLTLVAIYFVLQINVASLFRKEKVTIEVIQYPATPPPNLNLQVSKPREQPKAPEPVQRKVFGVSRKAITTNESSANTVEIKQGNTVAKENDNLKLNKDDADSIPIPADDYLVTTQVSLLRDVKIPYPPEARKNNIEGPVVMDIIIDQTGRVRQATLVRGPGYGLDDAAMEAIKKFQFKPARVGEQSVAVKIRYSYRFILENK